jgi:hypothetical protein
VKKKKKKRQREQQKNPIQLQQLKTKTKQTTKTTTDFSFTYHFEFRCLQCQLQHATQKVQQFVGKHQIRPNTCRAKGSEKKTQSINQSINQEEKKKSLETHRLKERKDKQKHIWFITCDVCR